MILRKVRSHLRRSGFERRLLWKAWFLLVALRLGLSLFPLRTIHRLLARAKRRETPDELDAERIGEQVALAVRVASRYVPGKVTCLPQAMAASVMLKHLGSRASLRIGVARGEKGEFQAHAWVEDRGRIIIGMLEDLRRFTPFPAFHK